MPEKKQDLFRLAFETSPDAINLNRLNDGLYMHANDGFAKMTGYTSNEKIILSITKDITHRKLLEKALQKAGVELEEKASELQELNAALHVLLQKREQDINKLEENIASNYATVIQPVLMQLKDNLSTADQYTLFDVLEKSIQDLVRPFSKTLSDPMHRLTPKEIQVSAFIKQGLSNKEIAQIFNCGVRTIDTHRDNIREKLGLKHTRVNLKSYLVNV